MNEQYSHSDQAGPTAPNSLDQAVGLIEQLQREVDVIREQLAWSQRLATLGTLAASLGHELNNLLAPVGSYAQMALADTENPAMTKKALSIAAKNVVQAGRLIDRSLSFASPSESQHTSDRSELLEAIDQSLACAELNLKSAAVDVKVHAQPMAVAIDELALQQVLVNLINNAAKAMQSKQGNRRLIIASQQQGGNAVIEVRDNGPGIDESIMDHLFEPFISSPAIETGVANSDLKQTTQCDVAGGMGLGLSICKRLIESANGMIQAQSGPGGGATFMITLPLAG